MGQVHDSYVLEQATFIFYVYIQLHLWKQLKNALTQRSF